MFLGADLDTGTVLGYTSGYFAANAGIFFLYSPAIILFLALLIAGGFPQLLLIPFVLLVIKLRLRPQADIDPSWLQNRSRRWQAGPPQSLAGAAATGSWCHFRRESGAELLP